MKLNVFKPKESVQSAIDRPDNAIAFVLVIIPVIASVIGQIMWGLPIKPTLVGLAFVRTILNWLILGAAAYVILYLAIGKRTQGKFSSVLSAVSLIWIINLLLIVLGIVFVPFIFSAEIQTAAKELATGQVSIDEFANSTSQIIENDIQAVNTSLGFLAMIIAGFLMLLAVYLIFLMVRDFQSGRALSNVIVTIAILAAWLVISQWVFYLVQVA